MENSIDSNALSKPSDSGCVLRNASMIVAGSRKIYLPDMTDSGVLLRLSGHLKYCIDFFRTQYNLSVDSIVSGTADGVDRYGETYAKNAGLSCVQVPARWDQHGRRAGFIRNARMASSADCLCAISFNNSNGTVHMVNTMRCKKKPYVHFMHHYDKDTQERSLRVEMSTGHRLDTLSNEDVKTLIWLRSNNFYVNNSVK